MTTLLDVKPIVTRDGKGGEYSTVIRPDKMVETMYFSSPYADGIVVGVSSIAAIAERHVAEHQATKR